MNALLARLAKQAIPKVVAWYSTGCVSRSPFITSTLVSGCRGGLGLPKPASSAPLRCSARILQTFNMHSPVGPAGVLGSVRHTTNGHARGLKTRQAAAKRFIKTGKGKLKHAHAGRSHLNGHFTRTRMRRLNVKGILSGTNHKNMNRLLLTGK